MSHTKEPERFTIPIVHERAGDATALYRILNADGQLLYVGITNDIEVRFNAHRLDKSWWLEADRAEVAWYESRKEAELAEFRAIRQEQPLYNVAGIPGGRSTARSWREVRSEVVTDEARVAAHRARLEAEVGAFRLVELRKEMGLTQVVMAERMGVSQARISNFENGDFEDCLIATVRAYVEALGGKLRLVADFGDRQLRLQ